MNARDLEYIENRLIAPAPDVREAIERLRALGQAQEEVAILVDALRDFTDECRRVRTMVVLEHQKKGQV